MARSRNPGEQHNDRRFCEFPVTLLGIVDDTTNPDPNGSNLTKADTGELALAGANTYRGTTFVNQGILTIENSQGLGDPSAGTVVGSGGQLQVQGGVTIATEPLTIQGNGGLQDDVQTVAIGGAQTGTFTLQFGGKTTSSLAFNSTPFQVKTALNALSTIGGVGGAVNVYQPKPDVYSVVFMGSFAGLPQGLLVGAGTASGATVVVSKQIAGGAPIVTLPTWFNIGPAPINNGQSANNTMPVAGRVTSVTTDPTNPSTIYIATAGGGAWKTINDGQSWVPLFDGISAVQQATITGSSGSFTLTFEAATTVSMPGNATADQIQTALDGLSTIGGAGGYVTVTQAGNVFTINFNGGTLAGVNVPAITASGTASVSIAVLVNGVSSQTALFTGAIAVSPSSPNIIYLGTGEADNSNDSFYGSGVYASDDYGQTWQLLTDSKLGNPLFGQTISQIVVDPYQPLVIYLASSSLGSNAPGSGGTAGIWRYDGSTWFDLTGTASTVRQTQLGANTTPPVPPNPPGSTAPPNTTPMERNPPKTPGPDDDYRVSFPQTKATWSDLVLVYEDTQALPTGGESGGPIAWANAKGPAAPTDTAPLGTAYTAAAGVAQGTSVATPVLYAALGTSAGNNNNGVFWCPNPQMTTAALPPDWYGGNPYVAGKPTAGGGGTLVLAPDIENMGAFPTAVATSVQNGSIKLTSFITPNPGYPAKPLYPAFNQVTLFAAITTPSSNGLSQIYTTTNGGFTWAALTNPPQPNQPNVPPTNYLGNQGNYNSTILAIGSTTVFVGGQLNQSITNAGGIYTNPLLPGQSNPFELDGTIPNTGEIYETKDGGVNWLDITTDLAGSAANGPHDAQHAMALDSQGRLLVGTDGGIWRFDPTTSLWTDLNGNLATDLVVAAAVDPTNPNNAFAGVTENGTAQFTGSPAADFADPLGIAEAMPPSIP